MPLFPDSPEHWVQSSKQETIASHDFLVDEGGGLVGEMAVLDSWEADTLSDIARHYGLGFNDISIANSTLEPWTLSGGQSVLLPLQFILPEAPRKGIVLNLASMRLFYYPKDQSGRVMTYPVGIGRDGWNTPLGVTQIVAKKANPDWTVPESIHREHRLLGEPLPKVIRSGPDNPLGSYAMPLGINGYLIHGTNKPYGIGMQVSHGCVQMYPEDIEVLFHQVDVGTSVRIVHQPYLAAWGGDMLYLEAHAPLEKWAKQDNQMRKEVRGKLEKLVTGKNVSIDWQRVESVLMRSDGVPTPVLLNSPDFAERKLDAVALVHPVQWYGQSSLGELTEADWSIRAASFTQESEAQKLAAMLNHQGPPIPARKVAKDGVYQVVAGPFKSKKEAKLIAKRIKSSFDMDAVPVAPGGLAN